MSLTRLIKNKQSVVATWFAGNFPETRSAASQANITLRGEDAKAPCVVAPPPGVDRAMVGTAVGYVISASLRPDALNETVATNGAAKLRGMVPPPARDPREIEREAVARVAGLRPWERELADNEWRELCDACCVLARFEQFFRAGMRVLPHVQQPLREHGHDIRMLAGTLASPVTRDDTVAVARAAVEDHADLRDAIVLVIGPQFAQSVALGGADADLIYDGTLIDLKASSQTSLIGREELYQLLGYLLADTDDQHQITHVGFSALRRRRRCVWPVQEFMDLLANGNAGMLAERRAEFAELLVPMAELQQSRARRRMLPRQAGGVEEQPRDGLATEQCGRGHSA